MTDAPSSPRRRLLTGAAALAVSAVATARPAQAANGGGPVLPGIATGMDPALFPAGQPMSRVQAGRLERLPPLPSRGIDPRPVDVWLPPGYDAHADRRFPVLYLHDGQNVFDGALVMGPWGGWHVDRAIAEGAARDAMREAIVVASWSTAAHRHSDYYPTKMLPWLDEAVRGRFVADGLAGRSRCDDYLRFLVEEVKPAVDARYRTLPGPRDTMLMGSSMGGLVSLYALCEHPRVFGAAACLSTHWIGVAESGTAFPVAAFEYLRRHLPEPAGHRVYIDAGDQGLDAHYGPSLAFVDQIAAERGWSPAQWHSRRFPGADHNERAWAARLDEPLAFLLGEG